MYTDEELQLFAENNKNARKFKNGLIFPSNCDGDFKIIGKLNESRFIIQFIETENIMEVPRTSIGKGEIKDRLRPRICGVGYIGIGDYSWSKNETLYTRWVSMLSRCYDSKTQKKQPTYIGCSVDESWHNFQNYARDIEELMKQNNITSLDGYDIDKDIKIPNNKTYSKETISIVTSYDNNMESNNRTISKRLTGLVYTALRIIDSYEEDFINQKDFARKYNLDSKIVNHCILGKIKSHKGWVFRIKE